MVYVFVYSFTHSFILFFHLFLYILTNSFISWVEVVSFNALDYSLYLFLLFPETNFVCCHCHWDFHNSVLVIFVNSIYDFDYCYRYYYGLSLSLLSSILILCSV